MKMKRTNFYYPQPMLDALKTMSDESGIPVSEIIRQAVGLHIFSGKLVEAKPKRRRKTKYTWIEEKPSISLQFSGKKGEPVTAGFCLSNEIPGSKNEIGFIEDIINNNGETWLHYFFSVIDIAKEAVTSGYDEELIGALEEDLTKALSIVKKARK